MKERPILFNGDMVRAILDGRKAQTRRVVKPLQLAMLNVAAQVGECHPLDYSGPRNDSEYIAHFCPYGQPGDRLWVRESFWGCDLPGYGEQPCVVYDDEWQGKDYSPAEPRPWARKFGRIPSIHMPRECSRITLEITEVRVERLQDISEEDAEAEGAEKRLCGGYPYHNQPSTFVNGFCHLWESINGPGSWDANPWVWVIEFRRLP